MSILNTRVQNWRAKSNLGKNENRPSQWGALQCFVNQSDDPAGVLTPQIKEMAKSSIGNVLQTPVFDAKTVAVGNTRTLTIADDENTSQMVSFTFTTFDIGFTITPSLYMNNEFGIEDDFNKKMDSSIFALANALDTAALTKLSAEKTQKFGNTLQYTVTGNVVQVPWKLRRNALGDSTAMLSANDHFGILDIVGNNGVEALIRDMSQSAEFNAINRTLQYSDKNIYITPRLLDDTGEYTGFYVINSGTLGVLFRFEREAVLATKMPDGTEWGQMMLPYLNIPIGTYYYERAVDGSALAGAASADMTRVRKQFFGFSVDVCFVSVYNSNRATIANPIMKFVVKDETAADALQITITNTELNPVPTQEVS